MEYTENHFEVEKEKIKVSNLVLGDVFVYNANGIWGDDKFYIVSALVCANPNYIIAIDLETGDFESVKNTKKVRRAKLREVKA